MVVEKLNALKTTIKKTSQNSAKNDDNSNANENTRKQMCRDTECPCHLFSRFKDYFFMVVPIICEKDDSLLKWTKTSQDTDIDDNYESLEDHDDDVGGKLSIGYPGFLRNENDILSDFISGYGDETISQSVDLTCDALTECCPLLSILVSTACFKIFLAITYQIAQEFTETPLLEDEYTPLSKSYYRPKCANCEWEEGAGDIFLMCGGCKEVYYCGESCQELHWKNEHKNQCRKTTASAINKNVQKLTN